MGKRGLLVALGFLAAAAYLWWTAGGERPQLAMPAAPTRAAGAEAAAPRELLAVPSSGEALTGGGERTAAPSSAPARAGGASPAAPAPGEGLLIVRVVRSDTQEPVPGQWVSLLEADGERSVQLLEGSLHGQGGGLRSDERGECAFRIAAGVRARAVTEPGSGWTSPGACDLICAPRARGKNFSPGHEPPHGRAR